MPPVLPVPPLSPMPPMPPHPLPTTQPLPRAGAVRRNWLCRLAALAGGACGARGAWAGGPGVCGSAPAPAYPAVDKPALVQSWLQDGRHDGPLPDCTGLRSRDFELIVRVTASFAAPGEISDMLARFGAVSNLKNAQYWSFTDRKRLPLIPECHAIDRLASARPRADFSVAEVKSGAELFYVHSDNRSSTLVPYSMQLVASGADGFQVRIENAAALRYMGFSLVDARDMQWAVAVQRLAPGRWGYVGLLAIRHLGMGRAEQHRLSNLSRAVGMFDLLAGRQTDVEPYR